ncbi:PAS domain-containing protein [Methylobacterium sp. J-078]|uniref:PAS domain-containing protein n=1 Tax=Methylobacterium sp. J-078 TaxID=2836657 RepID=UPI001FB8E7E4|nr:PAS domain-containing protein [Methylobacterium sp. J-078]MCJ2044053.1 PAS domain-containing protein [Methylobacterium sp. J-078]
MESAEAWRLTDRLQAEHGKGDPFAAAIRATRMAMIITDPRLPDNPIVFVNDAFCTLSGYDRDEIMGTNCRFLQGPDTDRDDVRRIREAVEARRDIAVDLLNYRKDGTRFWNALYMSPVVNEDGELLYFFASQLDVTHRVDAHLQTRNEKADVERQVIERTRELTEALAAKTMLVHEVDHRVKNNLQMISSLLGMQARTFTDPDAQEKMRLMLDRVEALGTVHRLLYVSDDVTRFDVADCARELATELVQASGRSEIRLRLELESVVTAVDKAAPVALMLNELVTNALKHAFADGRGGKIVVVVEPDGPDVRLEVTDDGTGMAGIAVDPTSFGQRLLQTLARQLGASVERLPAELGTRVVVRFPNDAVEKAAAR